MGSELSADIIDVLADVPSVTDLRAGRAQARENAQRAFAALLEPEKPGTFTQAERYAVAAFTALLHDEQRAVVFYLELLSDETDEIHAAMVAKLARAAAGTGPYGVYRETGLAGESAPGPWFDEEAAAAKVGGRLAAAFGLAHLLVFHPRDSRPGIWEPLAEAGWTTDETVSLAQLIAFLAFQLRVVRGLRVLGGAEGDGDGACAGDGASAVTRDTDAAAGAASESDVEGSDDLPLTTYPDIHAPERFVSHALGWRAWLEPVAERKLTEVQIDSLIKPERAKQPYFRLLARDPEALRARTLTDLDIFYNTDGGLGRAEREFAAAVTSRFNGCVYCASVHAGRTLAESTGREDDVERLLDEGPGAEAGSATWNAVRDAAVALSATPARFDASHVRALESAGLDRASVLDVINAVAFFNWANRLMLGLGEPEVPRRFR